MSTVTWDGKDFAAVQMATCKVNRKHGQPYATVDKDWNLFLGGVPIPVGATISSLDGCYELPG